MKALRTRHADALDQPKRWHNYLRPWFDVEAFQDRINERIGLNKDGKSIIRLVWGQDPVKHSFGQTTPCYWLKRLRRPGSAVEFTYWTAARWIFEKRLEPEQYVPGWEANRWSTTDEHGTPVDKGPPPEEFYTYFTEAAVHESGDGSGWPHCCNRAYYTDTKWGSPRARCWGSYRNPGDIDLEVIEQSYRQMEADKFQDPYRPLSAAEMLEIEMAANMQVERAAMEFEEMERQMQRDFNKQFAHILVGEPGPIHDMAPRPSGVIAPTHLK